jgi:hypothetical protein
MLQAVVKAQRIVLADGEDYAGVWHEDGLREHVAAVVLYYYRASDALRGGALEFCSKQRHAMWTGDGGGDAFSAENAADFAASLPHCQVPVRTGTLVAFSNYEAVHRVLPLTAPAGGGSRDFVALFIIDQRHPLPTPAALPPRDERLAARAAMLEEQLRPRGTFGLQADAVYSTGNGSVADVGWVARHNGGSVEEHDAAAATLIARLNLAPPKLARGMSAMAEAPLPPAGGDAVEYSTQSAWEEHWVGEGPKALVLYVEPRSSFEYQLQPPRDGVSEARAAAAATRHPHHWPTRPLAAGALLPRRDGRVGHVGVH